jgi:hypothetical protein
MLPIERESRAFAPKIDNSTFQLESFVEEVSVE